MKRFITLLVTISLLISSAFAENFFSKRYVEFKLDAPVDLSNNIFSVSDILTEEIVIDLTKIANELPESGFELAVNANPTFCFNLNLPDFQLGLITGVDVSANIGIGKGLFDFLGNGYAAGETLKVDMDMDLDAFVYQEVDVGIKIGLFNITLSPTLFAPVFHIYPETAYVNLKNGEDGTLTMDAYAKLNVYSLAKIDVNNISIDPTDSSLYKGFGFDMGGNVSYPLFDNLNLIGYVRIPVVPGRLYNATTYSASATYSGTVSDLVSQDMDGFDYSYDDYTNLEWTDVTYYINRPLKFEAYAVYDLIPDAIRLTGGAGFGVKNPFAADQEEVQFYPEYYFAARAGLGNIVMTQISTEYMNQIFKHELGFTFNLRLIELDAGVSLQSTSFISSFKVNGLGAYVTACVGF